MQSRAGSAAWLKQDCHSAPSFQVSCISILAELPVSGFPVLNLVPSIRGFQTHHPEIPLLFAPSFLDSLGWSWSQARPLGLHGAFPSPAASPRAAQGPSALTQAIPEVRPGPLLAP